MTETANGSEQIEQAFKEELSLKPEQTDSEKRVKVSRARLLKAIQSMPMDPMQVGLAAYINGVLQSARVDALVDLYLNPPNESWTRREALEAAFASKMDEMATVLEEQTRRIQVAQQVPPSPIHLVDPSRRKQ